MLQSVSEVEALVVQRARFLAKTLPLLAVFQQPLHVRHEAGAVGDIREQHRPALTPERLGQVSPGRHDRQPKSQASHRTGPARADPIGIGLNQQIARGQMRRDVSRGEVPDA